MNIKDFVTKYPRLLFIDVETTGLDCNKDEIIEFAYILYHLDIETHKYVEVKSEDIFVKIDGQIPERIVEITGITDEYLNEHGIERTEFENRLVTLLEEEEDALLGAYNTQFDALFTESAAAKALGEYILKHNMIDVLTIYRDRYGYPHKLKNAIGVLGVDGKNTHRAIDDIRATYNVFRQLMINRFNPGIYVNRFGYLTKYGVNGKKFSHIVYVGQGFNGTKDVEKYMDKYQRALGEN
jgi:DNA polymerase-3 subunit epsilon